jgi:hypothetical protein
MSPISNGCVEDNGSNGEQAMNCLKDVSMSTLRFPIEGVRKLMDHALAAPSHFHVFGYPKKTRPGLVVVKDDGIYLMSNGKPRLMQSKGHNVVVYADGFDPTTCDPGSVWDAACSAAGGDDFAEQIALDEKLIKALHERDCTALLVSFDEEAMRIATEHTPMK